MIGDFITKVIGENIPLQIKIREFYEKHGYEWQEENIIAVRNCDVKNDNTFQDALAIVTDSEIRSYICTTVPGTTWTKDLFKKWKVSGTGQYCLGHYIKLFGFGTHSGRAWRQIGMCSWYEDADLNKRQGADEKVYKNTFCHMDIHRTGIDGKPNVDQSSAGCIVPRYHGDLDDALNFCGWVGVTPPKKTFNGLITDTESFPYARELLKMVRKK